MSDPDEREERQCCHRTLWYCDVCGLEEERLDPFPQCECGKYRCDDCAPTCESPMCDHVGCESCMTDTIDGWFCGEDCYRAWLAEQPDEVQAEIRQAGDK